MYIYAPSLLNLPAPSLYPALGCQGPRGWAPCVVQQLLLAMGFRIVMYMSQCYSLSSSDPLLPPVGGFCSGSTACLPNKDKAYHCRLSFTQGQAV